jgi:VanZ family protein
VGSGATAGRASDWVLVLLYGGAVSALSQMSQPPIPPALQFSLGTLTLHAVEFGGFAFLLLRAFAGSYPRWSASRLLLVTVAVTAGFAVADEVHQYFVPGRHCEATDAFADVVGATIVAFLQAARRYKRRSRG